MSPTPSRLKDLAVSNNVRSCPLCPWWHGLSRKQQRAGRSRVVVRWTRWKKCAGAPFLAGGAGTHTRAKPPVGECVCTEIWETIIKELLQLLWVV